MYVYKEARSRVGGGTITKPKNKIKNSSTNKKKTANISLKVEILLLF